MKPKDSLPKISAIITLLLLALSWIGGFVRMQDNELTMLAHIHPTLERIQKVEDGVFTACRAGTSCADDDGALIMAMAAYPGYGGPLTLAVVADAHKRVAHVSILRHSDTDAYLARIMEAGIPAVFLGRDIAALPRVDAVSSATLSSTAIMRAVEKAGAVIAEKRFGIADKSAPHPLMSAQELLKLGILLTFFVAALLVGSSWWRWRKSWAVLGLATLSVAVLGFGYSMQITLSTIASLTSLVWLQGVASYAPLVCLLLAVAIFVFSKKNYYCAMICPYGCLQECLSRITACGSPPVHPIMKWCSRYVALAALCVALYFRNPPLATYEPFGQTFSFIGSTALFALAFAGILTSLFFKRPWCRLLCPMTPFFDYLHFWRRWAGKKDNIA